MRLRHGFAACLLAGCGSISDNSNNIDAQVVVDTAAPTLKSSAPGNMDTKVSVLSPISLFFDEALDESTVTAANIKVTYLPLFPQQPFIFNNDRFMANSQQIYLFGEQVVDGTFSYDDAANHKVSFVPKVPLPNGVTVTVTPSGVKDVAGNMFSGSGIKFVTYANSQLASFNFNSNSGVPLSWQEFGNDMNGRMNKRLNHNNAGVDTIWHTADDNVSSGFSTSISADGRVLEDRQLGPGPDGKIGTADDTTTFFRKYTYDAMNRLVEIAEGSSPGADGMFGTADDLPSTIMTWNYNASGQLVGAAEFVDPGTDTVFRTADDKCDIVVEWQYDAMGRKTRDLYKNCGADTLPRTADDQIIQYKDYEFDAQGNVTQMTTLTGKGPDNVFFTVDDTGFSRVKFDRSPNGQILTTTNYYDPGLDQRWKTDDDVIGQVQKDTLDDHGLPTTQDYYNAGPDGMFNTADDVIGQYTTLTYDANGNKLNMKFFLNGPDQTAHTADDRHYNLSTYDLGH